MLYVMPDPVGVVTLIVPVAMEHVGCWIVTFGTEGVIGCPFMVTLVTFEMQPALFFAVTLYDFVTRFVKTPVIFGYVMPSMLYVMPASVGVVTVIVPVETEQVGCCMTTVGTEGVTGWALRVTFVAVEMHPRFVLAVTLYVPVETLVKTAVVFV
jgi:hypothetical protein